MGWKVYGTNWETGELSNNNLYQPITFNRNFVIKAFRTWIIVIDDPVFTDLYLKFYTADTNSGGLSAPSYLLGTSESLTKSQIHTLDHGVKEVYFEFTDPIPVNAADTYSIVINGTGYVPTSGSYLAWRKAFPDPVYSGGFTPTFEGLQSNPYEIYAIGSEF